MKFYDEGVHCQGNSIHLCHSHFCLLPSGSQHLQDKEFAPRGKNSFLLRVEPLLELKDQSDQELYYLLRPVCPST